MDKKADPKKKRQPRPAKKGGEECQCQNVQAAVAKALAAAKPKRRQPRRQPPKAPKQASPVMLPLPPRVIEVPTYIPIPEESRVIKQTRPTDSQSVLGKAAPRAQTKTLATQTEAGLMNFPFLDDDQGEDIAEQFYRNKQQKKALEQMKKRTTETAGQKELLGRVEKAREMSLMQKDLERMKKRTDETAGEKDLLGRVEKSRQMTLMQKGLNEMRSPVSAPVRDRPLNEKVPARWQIGGLLDEMVDEVVAREKRQPLVGDLMGSMPGASMEQAEEDAAAVRKAEIDRIKTERQPKIKETLDKFNAPKNQKKASDQLLRFYNAKNKTDFTSLPPSANVEALRVEFAAAYTEAMLDPEKTSSRYDIGKFMENYTRRTDRAKEKEKKNYRESLRAPPVAVLRREEPAQTMVPIVTEQEEVIAQAEPSIDVGVEEAEDEA